jgi:hypothetical protein
MYFKDLQNFILVFCNVKNKNTYFVTIFTIKCLIFIESKLILK